MRYFDHRVRQQARDRPSHRLAPLPTPGRSGSWTRWLTALTARFGPDAVAAEDFEPPRGWDYGSWRRRRLLRKLDRRAAV